MLVAQSEEILDMVPMLAHGCEVLGLRERGKARLQAAKILLLGM